MRAIRRPRSSCERERQEDEEASDDILQSPAPATEQEVSEDTVSGSP